MATSPTNVEGNKQAGNDGDTAADCEYDYFEVTMNVDTSKNPIKLSTSPTKPSTIETNETVLSDDESDDMGSFRDLVFQGTSQNFKSSNGTSPRTNKSVSFDFGDKATSTQTTSAKTTSAQITSAKTTSAKTTSAKTTSAPTTFARSTSAPTTSASTIPQQKLSSAGVEKKSSQQPVLHKISFSGNLLDEHTRLSRNEDIYLSTQSLSTGNGKKPIQSLVSVPSQYFTIPVTEIVQTSANQTTQSGPTVRPRRKGVVQMQIPPMDQNNNQKLKADQPLILTRSKSSPGLFILSPALPNTISAPVPPSPKKYRSVSSGSANQFIIFEER